MEMEVDPLETMEHAEKVSETKHGAEKHRHIRLSSIVAITIALLATFMGVCKVKSDNIARAMQVAQADRIDNWNWYQARNIRKEVLDASAAQVKTQALSAPPEAREGYEKQVAAFEKAAKSQEAKMDGISEEAKKAGERYEMLNFHHDQFDIAETGLTIAISILAITALTGIVWLYYLALIPALFGILMGLAGLFYWPFTVNALVKFLGA